MKEYFEIVDVQAREILDSRGNPTVEVEVTLDDGTGVDRQILSGIHKWYKPEDLVGKKLIVVANLAPAKLCGVESQGMLLASGEEEVRVVFLDPETPLGERVR